jgi:hypothetical protein
MPLTPSPLRSLSVLTFKSAEDMLTAMFGPRQHDAHVHTRRAHVRHTEFMEGAARGDAACNALLAERREEIAQELAATHNYDTSALRHEYDRWKHGSLSKMDNAPVRARQLRRALDIACERAGAEQQIAAE